jgi:Family of unknown function (DUF6804)
MLTKIMKCSAIAALIGGVFLRSVSPYGLLSQVVVATAAAIVLVQAATLHRYIWMTLFLLVACLFNPVFPLPLSNYISSIVSAVAVLLFFFSLELLQPKPRLSIASITGRMPGSEAL